MSRLRLLRDERGFSMVFTLLTILVTSVTITSAIQYTTSNASSANRSEADQIAYALAEAGLANGAAVLSNPANNALSQALLPLTEPDENDQAQANYILEYEGGTVKYWGVLTGHQWIMHGVGIVTDPTGKTRPVRRHATSTIKIQPTLTQALNSNAWNYMFAKGTSLPCDVKLENSVAIDASMYILGDLCLYNSATFVKAAPPDSTSLVVGQHLYIDPPSATVGTSIAKLAHAQIAGGCRYGGVAPGTAGETWTTPCTTSQKVFADVLSDAPVVSDGGPVADFDFWYENAKPGPNEACTTSSNFSATTFESVGSTTMNNSAAAFNLTPTSSYSCKYFDIFPNEDDLLGELTWDAPTKTLSVTGVIFIDGSGYVSNNSTNRYIGMGTLYLSGTFRIDGNSQLCGGIVSNNCDFDAWDPNAAMLGIIANGQDLATGYGISLQGSARFQGSLYATANALLENQTQFDGPLIANSFSLENNVVTHEFPTITSVPVGWPGNPTVYAEPQPPQNYSG